MALLVKSPSDDSGSDNGWIGEAQWSCPCSKDIKHKYFDHLRIEIPNKDTQNRLSLVHDAYTSSISSASSNSTSSTKDSSIFDYDLTSPDTPSFTTSQSLSNESHKKALRQLLSYQGLNETPENLPTTPSARIPTCGGTLQYCLTPETPKTPKKNIDLQDDGELDDIIFNLKALRLEDDADRSHKRRSSGTIFPARPVAGKAPLNRLEQGLDEPLQTLRSEPRSDGDRKIQDNVKIPHQEAESANMNPAISRRPFRRRSSQSCPNLRAKASTTSHGSDRTSIDVVLITGREILTEERVVSDCPKCKYKCTQAMNTESVNFADQVGSSIPEALVYSSCTIDREVKGFWPVLVAFIWNPGAVIWFTLAVVLPSYSFIAFVPTCVLFVAFVL